MINAITCPQFEFFIYSVLLCQVLTAFLLKYKIERNKECVNISEQQANRSK